MRPNRLALLLLLSALLAGAGDLGAQQQIPSPYRWVDRTQGLGAFAGYLFTNPTLNINPREEAEFGPQAAPIAGLQYRGRLTGPLDGVVSVGFSPSERKIIVSDVQADSAQVNPTETGGMADTPLLLAEAGLRLNLTGPRTWRGLQPYAIATGGVVTWLKGTSDAEDDVTENERFDFGPSIAVGLRLGTEWYPTRRVSVNVEVSDRLWQLDVPQGFRLGADAVESEWKNNYGVSVGASYHF